MDGVRLSENCAIVLFLIDKYDETGTFGGKPGSPLRANLYKWCAICSPIDDSFSKKEEDIEKKKARWNKYNDIFTNGLGSNLYFGGNEFSAVDIVVGCTLQNIARFIKFTQPLQNYLSLLDSRDSFQKTFPKEPTTVDPFFTLWE